MDKKMQRAPNRDEENNSTSKAIFESIESSPGPGPHDYRRFQQKRKLKADKDKITELTMGPNEHPGSEFLSLQLDDNVKVFCPFLPPSLYKDG
ncbi:hypothetical protein V6N12_014496 [Hibiscus sabdariffa]|uniref:Uncharacterized protein n=1 Tax=Hibiscus sabdariffa TaxID=183260 RepID=A0ABR2DKC4_9ROSI